MRSIEVVGKKTIGVKNITWDCVVVVVFIFGFQINVNQKQNISCENMYLKLTVRFS